MPPAVKLAVLCDYALTSADGRLSCIGIFQNINFGNLPSPYPRFFVVLVVTLDQGTHPVRLRIVDPVGGDLLPEGDPFPIEAAMAGMDANLVVDFPGIVFPRAGIYQVQLLVSDRLVHSIPLSVQVVSGEGFTPAQA